MLKEPKDLALARKYLFNFSPKLLWKKSAMLGGTKGRGRWHLCVKAGGNIASREMVMLVGRWTLSLHVRTRDVELVSLSLLDIF